VAKRVVNIRVLPGEPLSDKGRTVIHLFVQDEAGPFTEPTAILPVFEDGKQVKQSGRIGPARGRIACDSKRLVAPSTRDQVITVTQRTDDPRATTCPKCINTKEYKDLMLRLSTPNPVQ
jgi:hypothetical protein